MNRIRYRVVLLPVHELYIKFDTSSRTGSVYVWDMDKSFPYTDRTPIKYLYIFRDLFMYGAERYTNRKFPRSGTDTSMRDRSKIVQGANT